MPEDGLASACVWSHGKPLSSGASHYGEELRESATEMAERLAREGLRKLGGPGAELAERPKGDRAKLELGGRVGFHRHSGKHEGSISIIDNRRTIRPWHRSQLLGPLYGFWLILPGEGVIFNFTAQRLAQEPTLNRNRLPLSLLRRRRLRIHPAARSRVLRLLLRSDPDHTQELAQATP